MVLEIHKPNIPKQDRSLERYQTALETADSILKQEDIHFMNLKEIDKQSIEKLGKDNQLEYGDLIGWSGIEKNYETFLRGKKGVTYYEVDAFGREV